MQPTNLQDSLTIAAGRLQLELAAKTGTVHPIDDLMLALHEWFAASCQALAEEAVSHCVTGDRPLVFNRQAFDDALKRLTLPTQPIPTKRQPIKVAASRMKYPRKTS